MVNIKQKSELNIKKRKWIFETSIIILIFIIDIITKYLIKNFLQNKEIIKNILDIHYVQNSGLAFSFMNSFPKIVTLINLIFFIIVIFVWIYMDMPFLSVCIGGALGNLIERLLFNNVTDFIKIINFPIFNFADVFIFIGITLTIISFLKIKEVNIKESKC